MIGDFRDVMLIIMSFLTIGVILMCVSLLVVIYLKISRTLNTVHELVEEVRSVTSIMSNTIIKPVIKSASLVTGARKALSFLRTRQKSEGGDDGKGK